MKDNLKNVGIWGQRHYQYLKESKPSVIGVMRLTGGLNAYLQQVNEQADEMCYRLVKQTAKDEGVDEALKKYDEAMNEMHSVAEVETFSCGFRFGVKLVIEIGVPLAKEIT